MELEYPKRFEEIVTRKMRYYVCCHDDHVLCDVACVPVSCYSMRSFKFEDGSVFVHIIPCDNGAKDTQSDLWVNMRAVESFRPDMRDL